MSSLRTSPAWILASLLAFMVICSCTTHPNEPPAYSGLEAIGKNAKGYREFRLKAIPSMIFVEIIADESSNEVEENFLISKYEVTVAEYLAYCRLSGNEVYPEDKILYEMRDQSTPIFHVDWKDSQKFCEFLGLRLPTESEWEAAAVNNDQKYTWGKAFEPSKANLRGMEDGFEFSAPVREFESGQSYSGVVSMCGNVWEWIADHGDGKERICKGGCYSSTWETCSVKHRIKLSISDRNHRIGIRPAFSKGTVK